jgi:pullulanase/glycogen debranching enzyme
MHARSLNPQDHPTGRDGRLTAACGRGRAQVAARAPWNGSARVPPVQLVPLVPLVPLLVAGAALVLATGGLAGAHAARPAAHAAPPAEPSALADCADGPGQPASRTLRATPALPPAFAEARAAWLDATTLRWAGVEPGPGERVRLVHAAQGGLRAAPGEPVGGAEHAITLQPVAPSPETDATRRFSHIGAGVTLRATGWNAATARTWHRGQLLLVHEDAQGRVRSATRAQHAGALDALYAAAEQTPHLGAVFRGARTHFGLWAPTAQQAWVCVYEGPQGGARVRLPMQRDAATGVWRARARTPAGEIREGREGREGREAPHGGRTDPRSGAHAASRGGTVYTYLVDVFVPGTGLVRQRVTDPYALSLTADSARSAALDLADPALQPPGWADTPRPNRVAAATDLVLYELHVRDFSRTDETVPAAHRGTYLAFTHPEARGMRHLRRLAEAGLTDVHLLPVFDLATVPERGCVQPDERALRAMPPDSREQQALLAPLRATDCYNWGYDPWHFTAPEGSYATDALDPARRILEFRQMVQALHRAGLRVGMDVVYNHTTASGQHPKSVLDRIVPGYYHRLDAKGEVERSTCCDNTATEHRMMARLMIDSAVVWARDHRIDSFRFDLMGHQPREAMLRLQQAVNRAAGRHIHLIGEGWDFGEVARGARFVQAAQGRLAGTGIATFSDRGRDAVRGGGCCDSGPEQVLQQGWVSGLGTDPNEDVVAARASRPAAGPSPGATAAPAVSTAEAAATTGADTAGRPAPSDAERAALRRSADLVRLALAGTLRDFAFTTHDGERRKGSEIDYAGSGAGYASQPGEVVNYTENHDNQTLFDVLAFKLPRATSREERARVQHLANAVVAFSQGIAYFHAGQELLRSKSMDRNSYDSGDWFNRLDFTFTDNGFAAGLPPEGDNARSWPLMAARLADARIRPEPAQIAWTRDAFVELLKIRASTTVLRLRTAEDIQRRLTLLATGPTASGALVAAHIDGRGLQGANFTGLVVAINVDRVPQTFTEAQLAGRALALHPVLAAADAADARVREARFDARTATFVVPARTAVVWVER